MSGDGTNRLMHGALLLTLASLISKVLSAGYRIPLQNLTGDIGFYIYQQIYPLLGIALILALYGFPSAISKITIELKAKGHLPSWRSFYIPLFIILLGINGFLFAVLFLNAPLLAKLIGDPHLKASYRLAAGVFLFIPMIALLRGVFQGYYNMTPTAYSQVGEQVIRVSIIISVAYLFSIEKISLYNIGELAVIASIVGMIVAIIILSVFFIKEKPLEKKTFTIPWKIYLQTIVVLGVVASLNHMILLIIQFADVFTLVPSLVEYGLTSVEAMKTKGVFDRGQPLIQLGTVLGSSFSLALIPAISRRKLREAPKQFHENIETVLLFTVYLSVAATIGLIIILPNVNLMLFKNINGTGTLQILVMAIFLSSLSITVSTILQGLGYLKRTALYIFIAFIVKLLSNLLLVPLWGINGSAVATVFSLFILCLLVFTSLSKQLPTLKFFSKIKWWTLTKAILGMVIYILLLNYIISTTFPTSRLLLLLYVTFTVLTGAVIYLYLLIRGQAFTKQQLVRLPFSTLLVRLHKGEFD